MTPQIKTAINNLMGVSVGRAAETIVIDAMKQQIAQNLSNNLVDAFPKENFRQTFFPSNRPTAFSNLIPGLTGMPTPEWVNYANLIVCQAIYYWASSERLNSTLINEDVLKYSQKAFINVGHLGVSAVANDPKIVALAKAVTDAGGTKTDFVAAIIEVIPSRILLYQDKHWVNGDLEIFDWLGMYLAMGGNLLEISALLNELSSNGLPQFPNMTGSTFIHYKGYLNRNNGPAYADFSEMQKIVVYSENQCTIGWTGMRICLENKDMWSNYYISNAKMAQAYLAPSSCCSEDTEVLLADGSAKLIKALTADDVIQGIFSPIKPLYVSKTPLSGRSLYELFEPGDGPRITEAHPLVNPEKTAIDSDVPAVLAISPKVLHHILPNHSRKGVGKLIAAETTVATCSSGKNERLVKGVERIHAIRTTDTSGHGAFVYDVILPFSAKEECGYWAGRNGKYVLVEPELIRLEDDPYVGMAIFELLVGLAEACGRGVWTPSPDDEDQLLRNYFTNYGTQILDIALRSALGEVSINQAALSKSEGAGADGQVEPGRAIDAFVSQALDQSPALLSDIALILENLSRYLYVPLSNIIRNGWRYFPRDEHNQEMGKGKEKIAGGNYLAITIMDLELSSSHQTHGTSSISLTARVASAHPENDVVIEEMVTTAHGKSNTIFRHVFDHVLTYIPLVDDDQPMLKVDIGLMANGPSLACSEAVPISTQVFSQRSMLLFDCHGVEIAKVHFDVRILTKVQMELESERSRKWGERDQLTYAVSLGRAMVRPLAYVLKHGEKAMSTKPAHLLEAF